MNSADRERLASIKHLAYESTSVPSEDALWLLRHFRNGLPATAKDYTFPKYAYITDLRDGAYACRFEKIKAIKRFVNLSPGQEMPLLQQTFKMPCTDAILVPTPYIRALPGISSAAFEYLRGCTLTFCVDKKKLLAEEPIDPYLIDPDNRPICRPIKLRVPPGGTVCYSANELDDDQECDGEKYLGAFFTNGNKVEISLNGAIGFSDIVKVEAGLTAAHYTTKNYPRLDENDSHDSADDWKS